MLSADVSLRKLKKRIQSIHEVDLFKLVWCTDALQSDGRLRHLNGFRYPAGAENASFGDPLYVYKWWLETLVGLSLSTPRADRRLQGRSLDPLNFNNILLLKDALRITEDREYKASSVPIRDHMLRIVHRQIEWQISDPSPIDLARTVSLYGGPKARALIENKIQIPFANYVSCGFALWAQFQTHWSIKGQSDMPEMGLAASDFESTLKHVSMSLAEAKEQSAKLGVKPRSEIAFRPSLLRQFPIIEIQDEYFCPLAQLSWKRTTQGLFYDVTSSSGGIRNEVAKNFEQYSRDLLGATLGDADWRQDQEYKVGKRPFRTPDIRGFINGDLSLLIECKGRRMSLDAKYNRNSRQSDFEEIAEGIFQLWRYHSHVRRGLAVDAQAADVTGLVLTLDQWHLWSIDESTSLHSLASAKADNFPEIEQIDRIPVAVASIEEVEQTVLRSSLDEFLQVARRQGASEYNGWSFLSLFRDKYPGRTRTIEYPLLERVFAEMPWWQELAP